MPSSLSGPLLNRAYRRRDNRTWAFRRMAARRTWAAQMEKLVDAYMQYKHGERDAEPTGDQPTYSVYLVDIFGM